MLSRAMIIQEIGYFARRIQACLERTLLIGAFFRENPNELLFNARLSWMRNSFPGMEQFEDVRSTNKYISFKMTHVLYSLQNKPTIAK